jgi:hypothetical protein
MPTEPSHPYDGVAEEMLHWLTEESKYYAEALRGGHRAPFAAEITEQQKLEYYRRQMFRVEPDGSVDYNTPNAQGRQDLLQRLGVSGYAQVFDAVKPKAGFRQTVQDAGPPEAVPPEVEQAEQGETIGSE